MPLRQGCGPAEGSGCGRVLILEMDRVDRFVDYGGGRARELSPAGGIDWDGLTSAQREELVDPVVREP